MNTKLAAVGLLCALMTACGGGGDDSPTPTPTPITASPEGRWAAKIGNDLFSVMTVLENGEIWGIYASGSTLGNLYGEVSANGPALNGKLTDINLTSRVIRATDFTGSVTPKTSMDLTLTGASPMSLTYVETYDQPANALALTGLYEGNQYTHIYKSLPLANDSTNSSTTQGSNSTTVISVNKAKFQVSDKGEVTMTSDTDCSGSGTILPRATGKNVFDVTLTLQGSACALENGTSLRGIALHESKGDTMIIQALNDAKTEGLTFSAFKSK
ncbi:hypothetical protein [Ottowia thiooxydans]|uniref:hypothetical protein n=1 Tax=Ottowia thiooxydans TaxID=219182 RepID=UPI000400A019|nr:hypothetical protein [Ottowia thiooxydans]